MRQIFSNIIYYKKVDIYQPYGTHNGPDSIEFWPFWELYG